ncbi:MAG: metallophosphoesterase [Ectobacillus sp.]
MKKITRRAFLKKSIQLSLYTILTTGVGYYYARYIEPRMLSVSYHTLRSPLIPKGFEGMKIVQFSDLHLGYHYSLAQLCKVVNKINDQKPDIVLFTGDLVDNYQTYPYTSEIAPILKAIEAPFGKLAIYGNHDHGGYGTNLYRSIMNKSGFQILQNEEKTIRLLDGSQLSILGIDDLILGQPQLEKTMQKASNNVYAITLVHEPDIASAIANYPVNLQLSGHSHGGQVQIPFIGSIITPPLAKQYTDGFYTVKGDSGNELIVYVNRGLGTTRIPFRCFARPEIAVFTLKHG